MKKIISLWMLALLMVILFQPLVAAQTEERVKQDIQRLIEQNQQLLDQLKNISAGPPAAPVEGGVGAGWYVGGGAGILIILVIVLSMYGKGPFKRRRETQQFFRAAKESKTVVENLGKIYREDRLIRRTDTMVGDYILKMTKEWCGRITAGANVLSIIKTDNSNIGPISNLRGLLDKINDGTITDAVLNHADNKDKIMIWLVEKIGMPKELVMLWVENFDDLKEGLEDVILIGTPGKTIAEKAGGVKFAHVGLGKTWGIKKV